MRVVRDEAGRAEVTAKPWQVVAAGCAMVMACLGLATPLAKIAFTQGQLAERVSTLEVYRGAHDQSADAYKAIVNRNDAIITNIVQNQERALNQLRSISEAQQVMANVMEETRRRVTKLEEWRLEQGARHND